MNIEIKPVAKVEFFGTIIRFIALFVKVAPLTSPPEL